MRALRLEPRPACGLPHDNVSYEKHGSVGVFEKCDYGRQLVVRLFGFAGCFPLRSLVVGLLGEGQWPRSLPVERYRWTTTSTKRPFGRV